MGLPPRFSICRAEPPESSFNHVPHADPLLTTGRRPTAPIFTSWRPEVRVSDGNPDPKNFHIKRCSSFLHGDVKSCVVEVMYPDCTNYEGRKFLVFKGVTADDLQGLDELDPHFCDHGHVSPFARFEPTNEGWVEALKLAQSLAGMS